MHAFTKNGKHLVIQDGFGLTRITFPKSVKTDKTLSGEDLCVSGDRLLVTAAKSNRKALRTVSDLMAQRFSGSDYNPYVLHPSGKHAVNASASRLELIETEVNKSSNLPWDTSAPLVEGIDLGRGRPASNNWRSATVIGEDGAIACFFSANEPRAKLLVGDLSKPTKLTTLFRADVVNPAGELLLVPSLEGTFIGCFDRALRKATIYLVTAEREVQRSEIDTITRPTFSGTYWCWQRDEATICRADWREMDKPERHAIPESHRGAGTIMAHADRIFFMPEHAESLVDVGTGKEINRKLPAKEAPVREQARGVRAMYDAWLAGESGRFWFGYLDINAKSNQTYWSPQFDLGACSLSAYFAFGAMVHEPQDTSGKVACRLTVSSYSNPSGIQRVTLDDVRRAFAALERYKAPYMRALSGLDNALSTYFEPPYADKKKRGLAPPAKLFDDDAATVLLRALFAIVDARKSVPLSANIDRWAAQKFTIQELASQRFADDAWNGPDAFRGSFDAPKVAQYIALDLLGEGALPVAIAWTVTNPSPFAAANAHIAVDAVARMIQYYPATEAPYREACAQSNEQGASMLRSLQFELGQ